MAITYKNIPYRFHTMLWSAFCEHTVNIHGIEDVAEMLEVDTVTIKHWIKGYYKKEFPFPSMNKFVSLCNLMDVDPAQFFTIEEI